MILNVGSNDEVIQNYPNERNRMNVPLYDKTIKHTLYTYIQQQIWIKFWTLDVDFAQLVLYTHYQLEATFSSYKFCHPWRRLTNSVSSPKDILKINSEKFPRHLLLWSGGPWSRGWKCASLWQGCSRETCPWSGRASWGFAITIVDVCYFFRSL